MSPGNGERVGEKVKEKQKPRQNTWMHRARHTARGRRHQNQALISTDLLACRKGVCCQLKVLDINVQAQRTHTQDLIIIHTNKKINKLNT